MAISPPTHYYYYRVQPFPKLAMIDILRIQCYFGLDTEEMRAQLLYLCTHTHTHTQN